MDPKVAMTRERRHIHISEAIRETETGKKKDLTDTGAFKPRTETMKGSRGKNIQGDSERVSNLAQKHGIYLAMTKQLPLIE